MEADIRTWLGDIRQAITEIESFFADGPKLFAAYQQDTRTRRATERNLEIIGEAANRILKKDRDFPLTNARQIVVTHNRIIHGYDTVSDEMVWSIVVRHLLALKAEVLRPLSE